MPGRMHPDRNDAQNVGETLAVALVIVELKLNLLLILNSMSQALHGDFVHGGRGFGTTGASRAWLLKEPAISTQYLALGIPRKLAEGVRGVDNRGIWLLEVAKNHGDGAVDST